MRKAVRATALVLLLACSARAGEMPCPPVAPPSAVEAATTQREIPNPPLVQVVLSLLGLL